MLDARFVNPESLDRMRLFGRPGKTLAATSELGPVVLTAGDLRQHPATLDRQDLNLTVLVILFATREHLVAGELLQGINVETCALAVLLGGHRRCPVDLNPKASSRRFSKVTPTRSSPAASTSHHTRRGSRPSPR